MAKNWGERGVWAVGGLGVAWVINVILSGLGYNAFGVEWDFERTAQLGDSFGVLSSAMAAVAAYFAYSTYKSAQDDSRTAERRAFEASFLNLLERRFDILDRVSLNETRFGGGGMTTSNYSGQGTLDKIRLRFINRSRRTDATLAGIYDYGVENVQGLSSFLRFTYHLVALIDRQQKNDFSTADKTSHEYTMIRLLRAQMTDSEILLIALNCIVGGGYEKFRPLVEKYALLHNVVQKDRATFGLDDFFSATAFGLSVEDRAAPDDLPPKEWLDAMIREPISE